MTVPGIIAHQSALKDGERLKIRAFSLFVVDRDGAHTVRWVPLQGFPNYVCLSHCGQQQQLVDNVAHPAPALRNPVQVDP